MAQRMKIEDVRIYTDLNPNNVEEQSYISMIQARMQPLLEEGRCPHFIFASEWANNNTEPNAVDLINFWEKEHVDVREVVENNNLLTGRLEMCVIAGRWLHGGAELAYALYKRQMPVLELNLVPSSSSSSSSSGTQHGKKTTAVEQLLHHRRSPTQTITSFVEVVCSFPGTGTFLTVEVGERGAAKEEDVAEACCASAHRWNEDHHATLQRPQHGLVIVRSDGYPHNLPGVGKMDVRAQPNYARVRAAFAPDSFNVWSSAEVAPSSPPVMASAHAAFVSQEERQALVHGELLVFDRYDNFRLLRYLHLRGVHVAMMDHCSSIATALVVACGATEKAVEGLNLLAQTEHHWLQMMEPAGCIMIGDGAWVAKLRSMAQPPPLLAYLVDGASDIPAAVEGLEQHIHRALNEKLPPSESQ